MPPMSVTPRWRLHEVDHRVRGGRVELARVGAGQAQHVAGVVDRHHLQAEAQAQARDVVLARVLGGGDLALGAPLAEAAGDDDAVEVVQAPLGQQALDVLGLDPLELDLAGVVEAAVLERLDDRQVGVLEAHVLADDPDAHRALGAELDPVDQDLPLAEVGVGAVEAQDLADDVVEALLVQHERDLVEVAGVGGVDDGVDRHVAEVGDLALEALGQRLVAAAPRWRRAGCPGSAAR